MSGKKENTTLSMHGSADRLSDSAESANSLPTLTTSNPELEGHVMATSKSIHLPLRAQDVSRFWSFVDKTASCWLWTGGLTDGYGIFWLAGNSVRAIRVAWIIHSGCDPRPLHVLHNCPGGDNRQCVNPAHLWLGTAADNMADKVAKGHQIRGEQQHLAKLTPARVYLARALTAMGMRQADVGELLGVGQSAIGDIYRRQTWKHLPEVPNRG